MTNRKSESVKLKLERGLLILAVVCALASLIAPHGLRFGLAIGGIVLYLCVMRRGE